VPGKLTPLGDRVVIKALDKEEVSVGGIIIPDTAKERPQEGEVIAVGPGRMTDDGKRLALDISAGDKVIFSKYAGTEVKIDNEDYLIVRESDVLAKIG